MSDIIVVGGGINGLLTAREFVLNGASVTLFERGSIGREASWAGGGILLPLYPWRQPEAITVLACEAFASYPALAADLHRASEIDPEWTQSGMVILDNPKIDQVEAWCQRHSIKIEPLAAQQSELITAEVLKRAENPCLLPEIAQVRNPRLLQALVRDLQQRGVRLLENHRLIDLKQSGDRIDSVVTSQGAFAADEVILATGAWSGVLCADLLPSLKIKPVKGQMVLFQAIPSLLKRMILDGGHYLIPRRDGRILAGSTVEHCEFDKSTTKQARNDLLRFAYALLPALKNYPVEQQWAGLRPGSPSGIPTIDRHPSIDNLTLNCGHFRNGLVMAPASARLVVDLVLNRPTAIDPKPYRIDAER